MKGKDRHLNVLIVDDDEVMGELLTALMSLEGYRVTQSGSAEDALERVREATASYDVLLCDVNLPGMRGGELARAVRVARDGHGAEGGPAEQMLLVGMSGSTPSATEARQFDGFLQKPFSVDEFAELVERIRTLGPQVQGDAAGGAAVDATTEGDGLPPLAEKTFAQLRSKLGDGAMRELYGMTIDDVEERLKKIVAAAKAGDAATVKREAHTIKGSCGMVGAVELQELAAATEGGSAVDTSALEKFDRACQRLRRMLEERL